MARPRSAMTPHAQAADLFGAALGRCDNGIVVLDAQARVVFWNLWIAEASGVPVPAAMGRGLAEIFPEARLGRMERAIYLALRSRQSSVLSRALNPNLLPLHQPGDGGEAIEHQVVVKPLDTRDGGFCLVQIYDVTDAVHRDRFLRRQAADLSRLATGLATSEATLRAMLEASPIGVAILSSDGTIRFANARLAALFLADSEAVVGAAADAFFTQPHNLLSRLGDTADRTEVQFRRRDGSLLWAQVTARPIEFEQAPAMLCWIYDISDHKKTERELVGQRDRATEMVRARTEFLAMVSHEIRTPLNGIMGTVRLLDDTALEPAQRDYVDTIRYSGDALLAILNDVLDISRLESGHISLEKQPFDLVLLVENLVLLMTGRAVEKGLRLRTECDGPIHGQVLADAGRLRQILLNLVGNAIKFTDAGEIAVRLEQLDESEASVRIRFSVVDTGIGIPQSAKGQLFTEFYQVDPASARRLGGTGLGLAICRRIVEAMGGAIGVESVSGAGSTFWFTLALEKDTAVRRTATRAVTAAPAVRPCRILLVEDNEINQKVAVNLLRRDSHAVVVAETGTRAVELASTERFDLILMDIQLPEMDGVEATRRIRGLADEERANVPILALTANAMPDDARRYLAAGMADVLTKPIDPDRLARAIARATGESGAPAEVAAARIDGSMLDGLRLAIGEEKVEELVDLFVVTGRTTIDEIADAADAGRGDLCAALAHRLKGGALNLGLTSVSEASVAIEKAVSENAGRAGLMILADDLAEAYAATVTALAAARHQPQPR